MATLYEISCGPVPSKERFVKMMLGCPAAGAYACAGSMLPSNTATGRSESRGLQVGLHDQAPTCSSTGIEVLAVRDILPAYATGAHVAGAAELPWRCTCIRQGIQLIPMIKASTAVWA